MSPILPPTATECAFSSKHRRPCEPSSTPWAPSPSKPVLWAPDLTTPPSGRLTPLALPLLHFPSLHCLCRLLPDAPVGLPTWWASWGIQAAVCTDSLNKEIMEHLTAGGKEVCLWIAWGLLRFHQIMMKRFLAKVPFCPNPMSATGFKSGP